jgi:hypothetical protein
VLAYIVQLADLRMIQAPNRADLTLETPPPARIRLADDLYGDSSLSRVSTALYPSPIPPAPNGGHDFMGSEASPCGEGHTGLTDSIAVSVGRRAASRGTAFRPGRQANRK